MVAWAGTGTTGGAMSAAIPAKETAAGLPCASADMHASVVGASGNMDPPDGVHPAGARPLMRFRAAAPRLCAASSRVVRAMATLAGTGPPTKDMRPPRRVTIRKPAGEPAESAPFAGTTEPVPFIVLKLIGGATMGSRYATWLKSPASRADGVRIPVETMSGTREIARDDSADDLVVAASTRMTTPAAAATPRTRRMPSALAPAALPCPDVTGAGSPRTTLEARSRIASSHGLHVQPRAIGRDSPLTDLSSEHPSCAACFSGLGESPMAAG